MSRDRYHVKILGKPVGPFYEEDLLTMYRQGEITEETLAWRKADYTSWTPPSDLGAWFPIRTLIPQILKEPTNKTAPHSSTGDPAVRAKQDSPAPPAPNTAPTEVDQTCRSAEDAKPRAFSGVQCPDHSKVSPPPAPKPSMYENPSVVAGQQAAGANKGPKPPNPASLRWARDPSSKPSTLLMLAKDTDPEIRIVVSSHPSLPASAFEILVADPDRRVRCALSRNGSIPYEAIRVLVRDSDWQVRAALAENPNIDKAPHSAIETPDMCILDGGFLGRLSVDTTYDVRREAGRNPSAKSRVFRNLSKDPHPELRALAARGETIDLDDLRRLARDSVPMVRDAAISNPLYQLVPPWQRSLDRIRVGLIG